jgi:predicted nucleic acid-binding protein
MRVVIDTNVFVAALDPKDRFHAECRPLFERLVRLEVEALCPALVLAETVCALRRRTNDADLAASLLKNLVSLPGVIWLDLSVDAAVQAGMLGARTGLRGGDAVVMQVAEEHGIPLVTKDGEMAARAPRGLWVLGPADVPA